jgi:hypothetical protein
VVGILIATIQPTLKFTGMKKRMYIKLFVITIAVLAILSILVVNAEKSISQTNGFKRSFLKIPELTFSSAGNFPIKSICGMTTAKYFFSSSDPRIIFSFDPKIKKWDTSYLVLPVNEKVLSAYNILSDSIGATLFAGNYGLAFFSPFNAKDSTQTVKTKFESPLFTRSAIISDNSVVLRALDASKQIQQFVKAEKYTGKILTTWNPFGEMQDGGFSTDGILDYDKSTGRILYVQYYQNRFFCLDSNLNPLYERNTIDTTNTNKLITRNTGKTGDGSITPGVPLWQTNTLVTANNGYIYIGSSLKSENEKDLEFDNNMVIDVYKMTNGDYLNSFYIPNLEGNKAKQVWIDGDTILALYKNQIAMYKFK